VLAKRNGLEISNIYLTLCLLEFLEIELSAELRARLVFQLSQVPRIGRKWADLLVRLTISQMTFFLEVKKAKPVMKSIEIESHVQVGISKGHSSPTGY